MQKTKDSVRDEQQQLALCGDTTSKSHVHSWGLRLSLPAVLRPRRAAAASGPCMLMATAGMARGVGSRPRICHRVPGAACRGSGVA